MLNRLTKVLAGAGKPAAVVSGPDGARILVLPHGGRILGLFAPGSDANFFWTNPVLDNARSARAFFGSGQWCNTGGDRTWLAPELDYFFPRYPARTPYFQPRQLDPGRYSCVRAGAGVRLENRLALRCYRTGETLRLTIVKQIEPAAAILPPGLDGPRLGKLQCAGYTQRSSLAIAGKAGRAIVGLWHLLQLPHGGQMLIPTYRRVQPQIFFGAIPLSELAVTDRLIRYSMTRAGEQKIGVPALSVTGRVGYLYRAGPSWALVVRNFSVNPLAYYGDLPWNDPDDPGSAVQACNVSNAELGHFSELEYHLPSIGGKGGARVSEEISQVWAFRGPKAAIRKLADRLLGA